MSLLTVNTVDRSPSWWLVCVGLCALTVVGSVAADPVIADQDTPQSDAYDNRRETAIEQSIRMAASTEDAEKVSSSDRADTTPAAKPSTAPASPRPVTQQPTASALTPDEIIRAIKLRAQKELARRRSRKWSLSPIATWTVANESNPNLSKKHADALYTEEYAGLTFGYQVMPKLSWQTGYSLDALNYNEFTDLSTLTNSLTTKAIYSIAKPLRVEASYTFDDNDYPYDSGSSTWDQKIHVRLRHTFLNRYYQYVGWTYLKKQYQDKLLRDGDGNRIPTKHRHDQRHTGVYEIGGQPVQGTLIRLKQEFYFNDSNDHYQDFYDAQDYKVKLSGSHDWTEHWSSSLGFTYELKRYERRNVTERGVAQQDYAKTYETGLTYKIRPSVDLAYSFRYKKNDSNDPAQTYGDITNSLALTASF